LSGKSAGISTGTFWTYAPVQLDPVDLRGLPRVFDDKTEWVPPNFLPTSGEGILFLDELTSAPQMTQAACYQLVLDRKLGELAPESRLCHLVSAKSSSRSILAAKDRTAHLP
jgi:hypothetical protein